MASPPPSAAARAAIAAAVGEAADNEERRRKPYGVYVLFLVAFLSVQFGHGSNIGVAVSLPGNSKAMNLALGSWVMVGVCVGLPVTPWACRTFGVFRLCSVCVVIDFLAILLMLWPGIGLRQIYAVRFLVGFFEAPFLPYLQEWLARFGKHNWNVWNTVLHAMVPLGENLGYIVAQELVAAGYSWQWAFAGQAAALALSLALCYGYGGRKYLDLSYGKSQASSLNDVCDLINGEVDSGIEGEETDMGSGEQQVDYPVSERWGIYWATNVSLAFQLGFLGGSKYVIRDYATSHGFSLHFVIFTFSAIALCGPALGGIIAMSGSVIRPDQWAQHKRTLLFLVCTSVVAGGIAVILPIVPDFAFWPALFACFVAAGGVYPAAQGIINIALTSSRVIEASVYQVQCNNILFGMPLPFLIGKAIDSWGIDASFRCITLLQLLAAVGFAVALVAGACIDTEERSNWHRLLPRDRQRSTSMDISMASTLDSVVEGGKVTDR